MFLCGSLLEYVLAMVDVDLIKSKNLHLLRLNLFVDLNLVIQSAPHLDGYLHLIGLRKYCRHSFYSTIFDPV